MNYQEYEELTPNEIKELEILDSKAADIKARILTTKEEAEKQLNEVNRLLPGYFEDLKKFISTHQDEMKSSCEKYEEVFNELKQDKIKALETLEAIKQDLEEYLHVK